MLFIIPLSAAKSRYLSRLRAAVTSDGPGTPPILPANPRQL